MRPGRRTTRWRSCWASGIPAGRSSTGWPREGNDRAIPFPMTRITHRDRNAPDLAGRLDFSFSGIKTAVLRHVKARGLQAPGGGLQAASPGSRVARPEVRSPKSEAGHGENLQAFSPAEIADICASFQRVVVETLVDRLFEAAWRFGAKSVGIAGGVSANRRLRHDARRSRRDARPAGVPADARALDRQRRDDRRGRPSPPARRRDGGLGPERRPLAQVIAGSGSRSEDGDRDGWQRAGL